jgi:hypothetical protein
MLLRYIKGQQVPPTTFLIAAALELGVQLEWLLTGVGTPYPEDRSEKDRRMAEFGEIVYEHLEEAFSPKWAALVDRESHSLVVEVVSHLAPRFYRAVHQVDEALVGAINWDNAILFTGIAAEYICRALVQPLQVFSLLEDDSPMSGASLNEYIRRVVPAIGAVMSATPNAALMLRIERGEALDKGAE